MRTALKILLLALYIAVAVMMGGCSFSVFPKQELPKPLPPDSSNVKRVDSLIYHNAGYLQTLPADTSWWHTDTPVIFATDDAPEPVAIPDNPLSDNSLIPALANERDYYRDKLFTAKDALAERDAIIQRLQEQGRQQAAHIEKLVALVQQVRDEVKPVVQAAEPEAANWKAIAALAASLILSLVALFKNKKPKA